MTTMVLNYSEKAIHVGEAFLRAFWRGCVKTLQGFMIGYMIARQTQANRYVAEQISRYEYNGDNYHQILHDLNQKTIKQINEEFGND